MSIDKVGTEIPSPVDGVLLRVLAEEDDQIAAGAAVAVIGSSAPVGVDQGSVGPEHEQRPIDTGDVPTSGADAVPDDTATSHDIAERVMETSTDVRPTQAPQACPASASGAIAVGKELRGTTRKISRLRGIVARRMTESLQISAQLTQVVGNDLTVVARLHEVHKAAFQQRGGMKLTYLPFFVRGPPRCCHGIRR